MVVYIEPVFAENMLIDYLMLLLCGRLNFCQCRHPWIASGLGGLFACLMPLLEIFNGLWFKIITLTVITYLCYVPKSFKVFLRLSIYSLALFGGLYGVISFISRGIVQYGFFYDVSALTLISLGSLLISVAALKAADYVLIRQRISANSVRLIIGGSELSAFIDSGNTLYYKGTPVVLVNSGAVPDTLFTKPLIIPYSVVGKEGALLGFLTNEAVICSEKGKKTVKCVIAVCEREFGEGISALLNPDLLKENA